MSAARTPEAGRPGNQAALAKPAAAPGPTDDLSGGGLPASKPAAAAPPELEALRTRIVAGDLSTRTLKELQKLSYQYPKNAEVAYILGQFYCRKLWMADGLGSFKRAIELEPAFRANAYLIKAVVAGLGNDSDHMKVRRFLVQVIGKPAAPFLEEILQGDWRQQVKDRASSILRELK